MSNDTPADTRAAVEAAVGTGMEWRVEGTIRHQSGRQEAIRDTLLNLTYAEADIEIERIMKGYLRLADVVGIEMFAYGMGDRGARSLIEKTAGLYGK